MPCSPEETARLIEACRQLLSTLETDAVLERAARWARDLVGAERARVLLLDEKTGEMLCTGRHTESHGGKENRIPADCGLTATVAAGGQARLFDSPASDGRFDPECDACPGMTVRNMLLAPLLLDGKVIGAAQAFNRIDGPFGAEHLELFSSFAKLAAAAVASARMHEHEMEVERARYELDIAADIQKNLLPSEMPPTGGFDFKAICMPAAQVGGDLYDVLPFPGGRYCAVIGDVSGKGVPAALYMTQMIAELRLLIERTSGLSELLGELNRRLAARSTHGMFITLLAAIFSPDEGRIEFASAGHHPPLIRRQDGSIEEVSCPPDPPLGIVPLHIFGTASFTLEPGETVLAFTDGMVEALDVNGNEFGLDGLKAVLAEGGGGPGTLRRILTHHARFTQGAPQRDDTTLVLVRRM